MTIAAPFTSSTPTTRPAWCNSVGNWRVSHPEQLAADIIAADRRYLDCYVTNETNNAAGRLRLWIGLRGNQDADAHARRILDMRDLLRSAGLSVRVVKDGGRSRALRVTDKVARADA